jgi:hypothetical protein
MNRRRLLTILPLAPIALAISPPAIADAAEPEPIDIRPVFKRSDYVIIETRPEDELCALGHLHSYYTVNCHTVAFPSEAWGAGGSGRPAIDSATPYTILATGALKDCPTEDGDKWHPHTHPGLFRWVD